MSRVVLAAVALVGRPARAQLVTNAVGCPKDTAGDSVVTVRIYPIVPPQLATESDTEFNFRVQQAGVVLPFVRLPPDGGAPGFTASCPNCRASFWEYRALLWFQVDDAGHLSGARITHASWDSTLNLALARAVLAANAAGVLKPLPPALVDRPVDLWLGFAPQYETDSSAIVTPVAGERHVRVQSGEWTTPVRESGPDRKTLDAVDDTVMFSFIVDTTGAPLAPSVFLERAHYQETAAEALRVFMGSRYRPAMLGSCKVPAQVVEMMRFAAKK